MGATPNPEKYIQVFGLRNHGKMKNGMPATELVYIHSKVAWSLQAFDSRRPRGVDRQREHQRPQHDGIS